MLAWMNCQRRGMLLVSPLFRFSGESLTTWELQTSTSRQALHYITHTMPQGLLQGNCVYSREPGHGTISGFLKRHWCMQDLMEGGLLGASMAQPVDACLKTLGHLMTSGPLSDPVMSSSWQPTDILGKTSGGESKVCHLYSIAQTSALQSIDFITAILELSRQQKAIHLSIKEGTTFYCPIPASFHSEYYRKNVPVLHSANQCRASWQILMICACLQNVLAAVLTVMGLTPSEVNDADTLSRLGIDSMQLVEVGSKSIATWYFSPILCVLQNILLTISKLSRVMMKCSAALRNLYKAPISYWTC